MDAFFLSFIRSFSSSSLTCFSPLSTSLTIKQRFKSIQMEKLIYFSFPFQQIHRRKKHTKTFAASKNEIQAKCGNNIIDVARGRKRFLLQYLKWSMWVWVIDLMIWLAIAFIKVIVIIMRLSFFSMTIFKTSEESFLVRSKISLKIPWKYLKTRLH